MIITSLRDEGYKFVTIYEMLPPPPENLGQTIYLTRKGDTLESIAGLFGITVEEIMEVNIPQISFRALTASRTGWNR